MRDTKIAVTLAVTIALIVVFALVFSASFFNPSTQAGMPKGLSAEQQKAWRELLSALPPVEALLRERDRQLWRAGRYDLVCDGLPTDQCYRMDAPTRFRGVWIDRFEGSSFYPGLSARPREPTLKEVGSWTREHIEIDRRHRIWLNAERVWPSWSKGRMRGRAFLIEFVGRKTSYRGMYGHMGMFGHEIIVDKVFWLKPLG